MLTVVMPCFNAAKYVGAALESVFAQSIAVDQVIVVDDGSTDTSAQVVSAFGARVHLLTQANQGAAAARNTGLRVAQGDLVAFLDADDLWLPHSLELLSKCLTSDVDAAAGMVEAFVSEDLDAEEAARRAVPPTRVARMTGALLIRRRAFERVGPFDAALPMGEMMDWFARFDAAGCALVDCHAVVLRRRIHATNTVHQRERTEASYLQALRKNIARRRPTDAPMVSPS